MIRRNGARPGDDVWVTGAIGDSGAGLSFLRNGGQVRSRAARALIAAYRTPDPPMAFGQKLYKIASAALDVSDGLIQDAGHLAAQSGIGLTLTLEAVPLSAALIAETGGGAAARIAACTAGDDYQILFTAPRRKAKAVLALAARTQTRVTRIGTAGQGRGVLVLDEDGERVSMPKGGYTHF
jgi:thiamine-monophosphate kinase